MMDVKTQYVSAVQNALKDGNIPFEARKELFALQKELGIDSATARQWESVAKEEAILLAEQTRLAEEKRAAEEKRIAEEKRRKEEARVAEEKRIAEEKREQEDENRRQAAENMLITHERSFCAVMTLFAALVGPSCFYLLFNCWLKESIGGFFWLLIIVIAGIIPGGAMLLSTKDRQAADKNMKSSLLFLMFLLMLSVLTILWMCFAFDIDFTWAHLVLLLGFPGVFAVAFPYVRDEYQDEQKREAYCDILADALDWIKEASQDALDWFLDNWWGLVTFIFYIAIAVLGLSLLLYPKAWIGFLL